MKHEWLFVLLASLITVSIFFYKTVAQGLVPFPGDALMSDFQPWRSASYEGYAPGGVPNKAQYPDVSRQIYPWKTLVIASLKQGKLPLWNPYNFSGAPLMANFQSAALYPLNIAYFVLPQIDAWTLLVILQPLLAIIFTYWYMRKIGSGILGAALTALSYGFSGFMAVWLEYNTIGHVILWLPLLLLAIESQRKNPSPTWLGILSFSHAAALLAGHPQVYAYLAAFSLLYALFRTRGTARRFIVLFSVLGAGLGSIQLFAGLELIAQSARSPHDPTHLFSDILIQPWQLLSLPFPNIFGNPATRTYWPTDTFVGNVITIGLVPLFFSLSALRRTDTLTKWFIAASGIVLIFITANPITYVLYRIPIPLITSSSPTLMSFLFAFSLSVVCGLGLDYWMTDKHTVKKLLRRSVETAGVLAALFLLGKIPTSPFVQHAATLNRALIYASGITAITLLLFWIAITRPTIRIHAVVVLLVVHALDIFIFFTRFNPFVAKPLVFPDHPILSFLREKAPERYWGYGTAAIAANFASQYNIFSPEGYDPLYPTWYGELIYNTTSFTNATRSDAAIASHFGDGGLANTSTMTLLNALSVRYILDRTENGSNAAIPNTFNKVFESENWRVYENPQARPRASVKNGTATILSYEPERVVIETESAADSTLTLTDTYFPGWKATIDEFDDIAIAVTDTAFRSVAVPAGKHTVTFTYQPASVRYGAAASVVSGIAMMIAIATVRRKRL